MKEYAKDYAKDFLAKSRRFIKIADENFEKYPDEAAFNATQAVINANDAFTIHILGKRASKDHREAVIIHKEAAQRLGDASTSSIVNDVLTLRDSTGYDVKKYVTKQDCQKIVKKAERFLGWVENIINSRKF